MAQLGLMLLVEKYKGLDMQCNNGLNNKIVETLVENMVAEETGDLKYLQDSMYGFVKTLKEIILGEYSSEFFNEYVDEELQLYGSNLEEFLKIPKMGLDLKKALNKIDGTIDTTNQEFKENLAILIDKFQTALDNMEYEARDPYDTAVELGFKGTKQEWLEHLEGDSAYEIAVKNGYKGTQKEWLKYIRADGFIQSIQQFATNDAKTKVQIPDYGTINSLQGYIKEMFENGGLPATPFTTKALMESSELVDGDYAIVTDDTSEENNGLYIKKSGVWDKSAYDIATVTSLIDGLASNLAVSKAYTDEKAGKALTVSDDLNSLNSGEYYATVSVLNSIVDGGLLQSLNYPSELTGSSAVRITVVVAPPSNYSVQSLEHIASGITYTRNGSIGGTYQNWTTQAVYNYGSLVITDDLSDFLRAGEWGIPQSVINANSPTGLLNYPTGLGLSSAVLTVSLTNTDRAIQEISTKEGIYRRVIKVTNKQVQEPWELVNKNQSAAFATVEDGMAATKDNGDLFWVYPNTRNTLERLTLYKRLTAQTQAIVFEQSSIDNYLIAQGAKWE